MSSCCDLKYQNEFDLERAREELANYGAKGIKKNSRPLMAVVRGLPVRDSTLLDIGGGVGAVTFELFGEGIKSATHVDISAAYVQTFLAEAGRRGLDRRVASLQGDFVDLHDQVEPADLVTLDKVICCYEDYEQLVTHSASKARRWYAYSLPRDRWWVHLVHRLEEGIVNRLRGKKFRSFVHPTRAIEQLLEDQGFRKIRQGYQREWEAVVFERGTI